jgi:enterobactin synthetase component D
MPRMMTMPLLPACCPALTHHWPLPFAVPGVALVSGYFDPQKLAEGDFGRCLVEPPASINRSVAKRQTEFLAGRLCAREAMRRLDGRLHVPPIGEDRAPVWPVDVCGSITHSTGWAAAIVGRKAQWRGLGLDTENLLSHERATRLAGEILTADELAAMAAGPEEQIALRVTLTFSIKEALFKALYPIVQKRFYFEDAQLVEWRDDGSVRLRLLTDLSAEWHSGKELDGQFGLHDAQVLTLVSIAASADAATQG